jgi:hypothetical protein
MKIKSFYSFINELSGTELIGPIGPAYGETKLQNKTMSDRHTNLIYSDIDGVIYTIDMYQDIYQNYLKSGGTPLDGFTKENINKVLSFKVN